MIKFSLKFWAKIIKQGLAEVVIATLNKAMRRGDVYRKLDWRYAKKTKLTDYVWQNMLDLNVRDLAESVDFSDMDGDQIVYYWENWVKKNIKYVSDWDQFKTQERWEPVGDVLAVRKGDCESQATLVYCLCRHSGIPFSRLKLFGGYVGDDGQKFGHVWLQFRCFETGNEVVVDTTFLPTRVYIKNRAWAYSNGIYLQRWWGFNELQTFKGDRYQ
jgi:transglutaminase-like putative cysteine protease